MLVRVRNWTNDQDVVFSNLGNRLYKVGTRTKAWGACSTFIKLLCHAVCTNRRFHGDCRKCRFGCLSAEDDLLHFFNCPILVETVRRCLFRLKWGYLDPIDENGLNRKLLTFCLPSCGVSHDCNIVLLVDAIISTHNKLRCFGGAGVDSISSAIQSRIMSWARTSSVILKVVNGG